MIIEQYCINCGHRNNHKIYGVYRRCRKCGFPLPEWRRIDNKYIVKGKEYTNKELIEKIRDLR